MSRRRPHGRLLVVGPGRLGLALGGELLHLGLHSGIDFVGRSGVAPDHHLFQDERVRHGSLETLEAAPQAILLTVPDARVEEVAARLARLAISPVPTLHTSGVLASTSLAALAAHGFPTGSVHPLVSIAEPVRDARKLRGAWYGVEGEPAAVDLARSWIEALDGRSIRIDASGKALYHTAAVFASNYAVALLAVAERLMQEAGVDGVSARDALAALALGAIDNVSAAGPVEALTGPIARGDVATVALHLDRLSLEDRPLYSVLAREALVLAQARGLAPEMAAPIADLIQRGKP